MDAEHLIREIQQINLIQQKLIKGLEEGKKNENQVPEAIEHLDILHDLASKISQNLQSSQGITKHEFEKIHHDLRTPLTPIMAYTELMLSDRFGKLTEKQREKTEIIHSNLKKLVDAVNSIGNEKPSITDEIKNLEMQNEALDKINHDLKESRQGYDEDKKRQRKELEQKNLILNKTIKAEEEKNARLGKKRAITIAAMAMVAAVAITGYAYEMQSQDKYQVSNMNANTGYVIQNLRGDTIDTWLSWRLVDGAMLHVNVPDAAKYPGKLALIKEVVESKDTVQLDDSLLHKGPQGSESTYYVGWAGALKQASQENTQFFIPQSFDVIESQNGEGEITVRLTDQKSGDGLSGYTKSIADDAQNQILKSEITIYETDTLTNEQFKAIFRHEFGHALGLAHSTAPEDLMHASIVTLYPYISDCDVDAIVKLYDGGKSSQVECEK